MKIVVLFVLVLGMTQALPLPDYITQCSKSDPKLSECLEKSFSQAWSTIVKGNAKYHIQSLSPLSVPFMQVNVGNTLQGNLTDGLFHGLENIKIKHVKWDLDKRHVETKFLIPQFKMTGEYGLQGRIIGLPLEGHGVTEFAFDNMDCTHKFDYNTITRDGKDYIDIKHTEMPYTITQYHLLLTNLFNGQKLLGNAMNQVLNENWAAVNKEINPYFGDAIGEVYSQVLQAFFNRVSLNEYFSD